MGIYDKLIENYVIFKDRIKAIAAVRKHFSITSNNVFHIFSFEKEVKCISMRELFILVPSCGYVSGDKFMSSNITLS